MRIIVHISQGKEGDHNSPSRGGADIVGSENVTYVSD